MATVINGAVIKDFLKWLTLKEQKLNFLKGGRTKIENWKFLVLGIHDNIKPIPDFAARPKNCPSIPSVCKLDQLLSEILQIKKTTMHFV